MPTPTLVALITLAAYRATRLATTDSILDSWRHRWFARFPPNDQWAALVRVKLPTGKWAYAGRPSTAPARRVHPLGQLIQCSWCIGWHLTGLVVAVVAIWWSLPMPLLVWPAAATMVGFLGEIDGKLTGD